MKWATRCGTCLGPVGECDCRADFLARMEAEKTEKCARCREPASPISLGPSDADGSLICWGCFAVEERREADALPFVEGLP